MKALVLVGRLEPQSWLSEQPQDTALQVWQVADVTDLDVLAQHLVTPQASALVVVQPAEFAIAAMVSAGSSLAEAAAQWQVVSQALLDLHKQHRQQLLLLDIESWRLQPAHWPDSCLQAGYSAALLTASTLATDTILLACCHYVRQQPSLIKLNTLLQASCHNTGAAEPVQQLALDELLHRQYLQQQRQAQREDELSTLQLQLQQQQLQSQLRERKYAVLQQQQHTAEQQAEQERLLRDQLSQHQQQLAQAKHENSELLRQLLQVQEQSESAVLTSKQQAEQAAGLEQENALLLDQLFKVQEQLEDYYLQLQQLKKVQHGQHQATETSRQLRLAAFAELLQLSQNEPVFASADTLLDSAVVLASDLFDPLWYLQHYLPAQQGSSVLDALKHFVTIGTAEGFNPGPAFDATAYLTLHSDVAAAQMNALVHFERYGRAEGRQFQSVTAQGAQ